MTLTDEPNPQAAKIWKDSRWLILVEFTIFALIWFADVYHWHHVIFFSKTIYLLALGWISLRVRGLKWKDIGFQVYRTWARTIAIGVLVGVGIELLELFITQPLLVRLTGSCRTCRISRTCVGTGRCCRSLCYLRGRWLRSVKSSSIGET